MHLKITDIFYGQHNNKPVFLSENAKTGNRREFFFNMQKMNDYIEEKFRIYEEHLFLPGKNIKIQKKRIIS